MFLSDLVCLTIADIFVVYLFTALKNSSVLIKYINHILCRFAPQGDWIFLLQGLVLWVESLVDSERCCFSFLSDCCAGRYGSGGVVVAHQGAWLDGHVP